MSVMMKKARKVDKCRKVMKDGKVDGGVGLNCRLRDEEAGWLWAEEVVRLRGNHWLQAAN